MKDSKLNFQSTNLDLFITNNGMLTSTCGQIVTMDKIRNFLVNNGIPPKLALGDNNLWGYVNKDGAWIIEPRYEKANEFIDGKAMVSSKGYSVQINEYGVWT